MYIRGQNKAFRSVFVVLLADRQQHFGNSFAALLQTVSSCRGPIYRARIYENTHVMGNENVCAVKWKRIFNNVKTRIC